jgi:hypothetical protein
LVRVILGPNRIQIGEEFSDSGCLDGVYAYMTFPESQRSRKRRRQSKATRNGAVGVSVTLNGQFDHNHSQKLFTVVIQLAISFELFGGG